MKSFACIVLIAQAVMIQNAYAQCLRSFASKLVGPIVASTPTLFSAPPCGCGSNVVAAPSPCGNFVVATPSPCGNPVVAALSPCGNFVVAAPSPCGNPVVAAPSPCGNFVVAAPSPCGNPVVAAPTVVGTPSVANSLADTLSLLTVSSLLAETLPGLSYPGVVAAPAYSVGGCGCGFGSNFI